MANKEDYLPYISNMDIIRRKAGDFFLTVSNSSLATFIISSATSYVRTMKLLVWNTLHHDLGLQNYNVIVVIAGLLGVFGLFIVFSSIRVMFRLIMWLLVEKPKNRYDHGDDAGGNTRQYYQRTQHSDGYQFPTGNISPECRRWFKQAMCDFKSARNDIDGDRPAPEWVCFKCQQAMEKGLKAYIMYAHKDMSASRMTHDLCELAELTNDVDLRSIALRVQGLVGATPRMRYPDFLPFPKIPRDVYSMEDALAVSQLTETGLMRVKLLLNYNSPDARN